MRPAEPRHLAIVEDIVLVGLFICLLPSLIVLYLIDDRRW